MLDTPQFTRVRALAHAVVADTNRSGPTRTVAQVRKCPKGARITVSLQAGSPAPSDTLSFLGELCDKIVSELRLERDDLGRPAFRTSESTFTSGDSPTFSFEVWEA